MLGRLRLRAGLVARNQQQGGVHHRGTVQHGCHENVVPGAIDEAHVAHQLEATGAGGPVAREAIVLARPTGRFSSTTPPVLLSPSIGGPPPPLPPFIDTLFGLTWA
uniref:Uncharacterized protein n=1 Tax=Anopheles coluzzii TaxID=1518534 RepID=A0A8W7PAI2_ANOCL